jgi:glycosyltransferase involved in cell wall biosynthesis
VFVNLVKNLVVAIRGDYDIAHLIDGGDILLPPFLLSRKPKVFDVRSLWSYMSRREWTSSTSITVKIYCFLKDLITRIMITKSDRVIAVDPKIGQMIKRLGAKDIVYLRNMPEENMFKNVPFNQNSNYIDFAYIGIFGYEHHMEELLEAWHQFVPFKSCRLFFIGWDSSGYNYFENVMEPFIDNKTVFYMGSVPFDSIASIYRIMDFIVIPNKSDHWQLKLGETLAAGIPVILRDGLLHRKMVGSKGVVYFESDYQERDTGPMRDALERAFINRDELAAEALSKTPSYWERDVEHVVEVYKKILGGKI